MIERLYIHNFRCLENFTLDLVDCPSALLIGRNGAGKSTVLHSLRLLQSICRGSSRVGDLISAGDFSHHRTDLPMRFEADAVLAGRRFQYSLAMEWPAKFREARIQAESLIVDGISVFSRNQSQIQLPGNVQFGLDWHTFALPVINEKPGERAIQDLKAFFAGMVLVSPIPATMTGFSEAPTSELRFDASNFASCLLALLLAKPAAYGHFVKYVKSVIPDFASIENVQRGESGTQLIVKFERGESEVSLAIEFKSLSDGEKCFFLSALVLASNTVGPPVFCMWDEPDNHLSLPEVGQFITALRKASARGGQFVATTHHPETIRRFSRESTYVLTRSSHMEPTVVRLLEAFQVEGDLVDALIRDEVIGLP